MAKDKDWTITINPPGGFAPSWFSNSWTGKGNKDQSSDMTNVDLTDPNVMTQGPGMTDLTGGTQDGELGSVLITSIAKSALSDGVTYAAGANKVFRITNVAVTNGNFPKTITAGTANVAESVLIYQGKTFVFWNDTGVDGDIGLLTSDTVWDDNWGSTVATGAAQLEDAPHYGIVGGDDIAYVTNGKYIATINGTTLNTAGLDFHDDAETSSITWNGNRAIVSVNRPNISGSNFNQSAIYKWNGTSSSWEGDPIEVNGQIGALYTKNGTTFVWHKDSTDDGGYWLGRINGSNLEMLKRYKGSLPNQEQVGEYKGHIQWVSDNKVFMFGAADTSLGVKLFQYCSGKHATIGAIASPFGDLLVSSYATTSFSLSKATGYTVSSTWKSIAFDVNGVENKSQIDLIMVQTEEMSTGAKVDFNLVYDKGKTTKALTQIAYASTKPTRHKILNRGPQVEDFRIDTSFVNGSATNPVKIRSILIKGHYVTQN